MSQHDSDLRGLLADAVSDVHPDDALGRIQARTRRPSATRWVPLTVAAAAATAVVIGGAAWFGNLQPGQDKSPAAGPGTTKQSAPQKPAAATRDVDATVYYVGDAAPGPRLYPESRHLTGVTSTDLQAAVDDALSGTPADPDYQNPFASLGVTAKASVADGTVTIDLSEPVNRPSGMDEKTAEAAVQALVWTADTAAGGTQPVRFTVDGSDAAEVLGVPTTSPVERGSEDSIVAPVLIASPTQGATVPTQFTVTGRAATFEATVVWELKRGDTVVRNGFTTAHECCTLSPYSFTVTVAPGQYTLVVHDTDESGGAEGFGTSEDTKAITVEE
jgi:hypothetical protein